MKALIYVIAIVAILTGGWFSYGTMKKFGKLQNDRIELDKQNKTRSAYIVKTKKEAKGMEGERDKAKTLLAEAEAELTNVEANTKLSKREGSAWQSKITEQDNQLAKTEEVIKSIKDAFKELGGDIQLEEVPALVGKLEDQLKDSNRKLEELQALSEAANRRLEGNNTVIADLSERIQKRAERIASNKTEGLIVAVNHDWGFAIVNVPNNMQVDENSKLIVKRGLGYIGKLKINAIEAGRIVADVDYKSMTAGMVVQPGDSVVLAKPIAN